MYLWNVSPSYIARIPFFFWWKGESRILNLNADSKCFALSNLPVGFLHKVMNYFLQNTFVFVIVVESSVDGFSHNGAYTIR